MRLFIGADPGKSGGVGFISEDGKYWAEKMPDSERDLWDIIGPYGNHPDYEAFAMVEQVHAMPKQGVVSVFTFGMGYGGLRMAFIAAGIPFEGVTPGKWQKALGCMTGGDKNVSKARAQQLFPAIKITHALADALLIAEHCRRARTA